MVIVSTVFLDTYSLNSDGLNEYVPLPIYIEYLLLISIEYLLICRYTIVSVLYGYKILPSPLISSPVVSTYKTTITPSAVGRSKMLLVESLLDVPRRIYNPPAKSSTLSYI